MRELPPASPDVLLFAAYVRVRLRRMKRREREAIIREITELFDGLGVPKRIIHVLEGPPVVSEERLIAAAYWSALRQAIERDVA